MDVSKRLSALAAAQEECVRVMHASTTPQEIRSGFLTVADIMEGYPGQTTLANGLRMAAQQGALDDQQILALRDKMVSQFTQQSHSLCVASKTARKSWWQFWKR